MAYSIREVAEVFVQQGIGLEGQSSIRRPGDSIEHLAIDSRKVSFAVSSLFFALKTINRDGQEYIKQAYDSGVRNFVLHQVPEDPAALAEANLLIVTDTTRALQYLAAHHRSRFTYPVIGITGSNGKTIVKEWLNDLLGDLFKIVRSPRSFNSQIGVPLSVWEMSDEDNLGIFEAGISTAKEMEHLQPIIAPTIGILTNIGDAHDGGFANKKQKLQEKLRLFKGVRVLFYNAGQDWVCEEVERQFKDSVRLVRIGYDQRADVVLHSVMVNEAAHTTAITSSGKQSKDGQDGQINYTIPFTDQAAVQNAAVCQAVAIYLGMSREDFIQKASRLPAIDMRLQVMPAINRCSVINDSYSLDQNSLQVALDLLNQQLPSKTLILSDIPGLRTEEKAEAYLAMAELIGQKNIRRVITIGAEWQAYAGLLNVPVVEQYANTASFTGNFQPGQFKDEAILLKGARSFQFEQIFSLLQQKVHQTRLEINLTAIVHNQKVYRSVLKPGVKMMAMVKAFAYGSGLLEMASVLQYHNIDYLAVAYADEGVTLRNGGITVPVMVMNMDEYGFETLVAHGLEPEIYSFRILNQFMHFLSSQGLSQYPIHIKLDTGMHRLGFDPQDVAALAALLGQQRTVYVKSVFSHFTSSEDDHDDSFSREQGRLLLQGCALLEAALGYTFIRHIANSAAIARFPEFQLDMVRLGIGLYGINTTHEELPLRTVATLKATIAQIKEIEAGESVGYNRMGKVTQKTRIATIRIGYADGFSRLLSNGKGKVWLREKVCPVIGNVCMDMTMIDISVVPEAREGDEVEIFGTHLPVQQMAAASGTSSYEIFTSIGQRINRIYVED